MALGSKLAKKAQCSIPLGCVLLGMMVDSALEVGFPVGLSTETNVNVACTDIAVICTVNGEGCHDLSKSKWIDA